MNYIIAYGGGMNRWEFRSCEQINRYEPCQRAMRMEYQVSLNIL